MNDLSRDQEVRRLVVAQMPGYRVATIIKLGEGLENIAYVVNDELIVRFSKEPDPRRRSERIRREIGVLTTVRGVSPLPVPELSFAALDQGCLAYGKLPGVPLWDVSRQQRLAYAAPVAAALGEFLSAIHAIPVESMVDLTDTDADPLIQWRGDAAELYAGVAAHVPLDYRPAITAFLAASPPDDGDIRVFSHNDLGIQHVLVDPDTPRITGIIDWSDAAIADPAYDFGLIYRDLGRAGMDAALGSYRIQISDLEGLRQRAVFYARCSVFEDLAYGLDRHDASFVDNSLAALEWLFT